jgi:Tol biopolymer transport system component
MSIRHKITFLLAILLIAVAFPAGAAKGAVNGKIAFVSDRDGNSEIYVMNPDGSEQTRLTNNPEEDVQPAWSPDGRRIAFVRSRQIHVMNADGSGVIRLTQIGSINESPAWSPDGRLIAFQSSRDSDRRLNLEIYVMAADGTNQTRLTNFIGLDFSPAWSPDGRSIAFVSRHEIEEEGQPIYLMNPDGTNVRQLTDTRIRPFDNDPSFSPDGRTVVFARFRSFAVTEDVMSIPVGDGSDETKLEDGTMSDLLFTAGATRPVFSPDGKKIAFAGDDFWNDAPSIRIIDPDGSNEVELTHNKGVNDTQPNWQRAIPAETTGLYDPSTGKWFLHNSNTSADADIVLAFGGQPGDLPVAGDWNGDGRTDIAVFRDGKFVRALLVPFGSCIPCQLVTVADPLDSVAFGQAGDLPVAGDWDGDGKDDLGVFRPGALGEFLLRVPQQLDLCPVCIQPQTFFTTQSVVLGAAGFLPVAGDWDGDGKADVGVFDPVTGNFFLTEDEAKPNFIFPFGQSGDRPLAGDWLGLGRDGIGVFQPFLLRMVLASQLLGPPDIGFTVGPPEGLPVAGHWTPLGQ